MSENRQKIMNYITAHPNATEDEIALDLALDVVTVLDVLVTLEKEGAVKSCEV